MSLPVLEFTGNLTKDPELRFTKDGKAIANMSVACNSRKKDANGDWVDGDTTFINLTAFGHLAENIVKKFSKGNRVGGKATWKQRSYETDDGSKRTVYEGTINKMWEEVSQFEDRDELPVRKNETQPDVDPWNSAPVGVTEEEAPPF